MSALGSSGAAGTGYFPSSGNYLDGGGAPHTYSTFLPSGGDVAFGTAYRASGGFAGDFLHVAMHSASSTPSTPAPTRWIPPSTTAATR